MLPRVSLRGNGQELGGPVGVARGERGQDRDLATVQHALADAAMLLEVVEGVGPSARGGEGAGSVREEDAPEPRADLLLVLGRGGEDGRYIDVLDPSGGSGGDGFVEGKEVVAALVWAAVADHQPSEVDDRLEGADHGGRRLGAGMEVGGGVLVAQVAGQVGIADVGGEEGGLVVGGGGQAAVVFGDRGVGQADDGRDALREGQAGGAPAGDEREAPGHGTVRVHASPRGAMREEEGQASAGSVAEGSVGSGPNTTILAVAARTA